MINWVPNPDCKYKNNYEAIFADIANGTIPEVGAYRALILDDLFFILQFVMEIPPVIDYPEFDIKDWPFCNSPWVVERCKEVEQGRDGWCMDLWARGHFKSTTKTLARTIQRMAKYPNKCTMIASHTRPAAKKFLRSIMQYVEKSAILKAAFPDVFWADARKESPKWSEDDGIVVRRTAVGRVEATVEAWGLKEGMPIGVHFDWILADDLETKDDVKNPEVIAQVRDAVDLTEDLLTGGGSVDITGTPYSHQGVYMPFLQDKKRATGSPAFHFRRHPATDDGLATGKSLFLPQVVLDDIKARKGEYSFNTQQLINPTPVGVRKLEGSKLQDIEGRFVPRGIFKFMVVDPAGDDKGKDSDAWAALVIGVEPHSDNMGMNNIYITDAYISPMREEEAPETIARMYMKAGLVMQLGIEKVGQSTAELHVAAALAKQGRFISQENGSLVILRPAGRNKNARIEKAIPYPLYQNKIFISKDVPVAFRDRLRQEMDMYPFWHDDGLDCLSYFYDMVTDYRFGWYGVEDEVPRKVVNFTGRSAVTGY
jgi:hypothetical protein